MMEGRYELHEVLGRGGMGLVHRAVDVQSGQQVAIKSMDLASCGPTQRRGVLEQFRREADALLHLAHPNLPRFLDFREEEDTAHLVMEFIPGCNLAQRVAERGPLPEAEALDYVKKLASVLEYLHGQEPPIIFRDLKPSNVMLQPDGELKLIDFGLVKSLTPESGNMTQSSARGLVSPGFSAPEQYAGGTDERSDIYALGATAYFLLTGKAPPESIELATSGQSVPPPSRVSAATADLVSRMLQLRRGARPGSARRVLEELSAGETQEAETRRVVARPPRPARRRTWPMALAALLLVLLGGLAWRRLTVRTQVFHVESEPAGAEVSFGGQRGVTPCDLTIRGPGQLKMHKEGCLDTTDSIRAGRRPQSFFRRLAPNPDGKTEAVLYPAPRGPLPEAALRGERHTLHGYGYVVLNEYKVEEQTADEVVLRKGDGKYEPARLARLRVVENAPVRDLLEQASKELEGSWQCVRWQRDEEGGLMLLESSKGPMNGRALLQVQKASLDGKTMALTLFFSMQPCPDVYAFTKEQDFLRSALRFPF